MTPELINGLRVELLARGVSLADAENHLNALLVGPEMAPNGKAKIGAKGTPHRDAVNALLGILFPGQGNMYISPWTHSGVSTCIVPTYKGKVALGLRLAREREGQLSLPGGFASPDKREPLLAAAVREFKEEVGFALDPARLKALGDYYELRDFMAELAEMHHYNLAYTVELTAEEAMHLTSAERPDTDGEMGRFALYDEAQVEALIADGKVAFPDQIARIRMVFAMQKMQAAA